MSTVKQKRNAPVEEVLEIAVGPDVTDVGDEHSRTLPGGRVRVRPGSDSRQTTGGGGEWQQRGGGSCLLRSLSGDRSRQHRVGQVRHR